MSAALVQSHTNNTMVAANIQREGGSYSKMLGTLFTLLLSWVVWTFYKNRSRMRNLVSSSTHTRLYVHQHSSVLTSL